MRLAVLAASLIAFVAPSAVHSATCTVTVARALVKFTGDDRPLPEMVGFAIPVTVDESAGTFAMDFTNLPVGTFSISGVANSMKLQGGTVSGRIDAAGHVALPPTQVDFTTAFLPPGSVLSTTALLTTGLAAVSLSGVDYVSEGAALDFQTGAMRIEGQGIVQNAPVVGTATSGISLACTLAPIPSQDRLPKAASLVARGAMTSGDAGDTLVVKAKVKNAAALDPTQDVFVRLAAGGADAALVRVPAGSLSGGKKLGASDQDGSVLHVVKGRKDGATVAGSISVAKGKKTIALKLQESGLDLSAVTSGDAAMSVGIGPVTLTDAVTVKPGKKKTTLK